MTWLIWALAAAGGLYGLHRLALRAERLGLLTYTKPRGSGGAGNALLELQAILEPGQRYVIEEREQEHEEQDEAGAPPSPKPPAAATGPTAAPRGL